MSTATPTRRSPDGRTWHQKLIVEERYVSPATRRRLVLVAASLIVVGAVCFTVLLIGVLTHEGLSELDRSVELWINTQRSAPDTAVAISLAIAFGPIALPIIVFLVIAIWFLTARHFWRPIMLVAGMLLGLIVALAVPSVVERPRPPIRLMLFGPDPSFGFPSGHVLGTADFLLLTAFLIASRKTNPWWAIIGFAIAAIGIAAQIVSRIYLGYHWLTDTLASVSLSLIVLGIVIAVDTWRTVRVPGEPITGEYSKLQTDGT